VGYTRWINARRVFRILLLVVAGFTIAGVVSQVIRYHFHVPEEGWRWTLIKGFDMDREDNFPTWYASMSLALAALLMALIAEWARRVAGRWARHWQGLALLFVGLSMDELLELHERLIDPMKGLLHLDGLGIFRFAWVIPGLAGVAVLGLAYLRFLGALPPRIRRRIVLAGALYVVGAVGFEMLGGAFESSAGRGLAYALIVAVEETLEMLGVAVLIGALLEYIAANRISVHVAPPQAAASSDVPVAPPGRFAP
jgi:hypothetical protein